MPFLNNIVNQKGTPAIKSDDLALRPAPSFPGRVFINQTAPYGIYQEISGIWVNIADTGAGATGTLQTVTDNGNTTTNQITTTGFIKSGGTSLQFLKADGSIDNSTYLTASNAVTSIIGTANQVIASGSTGNVTLSLPQSIATSSDVTFNNIAALATVVSSNGGVFKGQIGSNGIGRTDAQIEVQNTAGGHALISIYNNNKLDEGAISFESVLSDASVYQQVGQFTRFVNGINTIGAYNNVWGIHCVSGTGDKTPLLAYSNNSLYLLAGDTTSLPWNTLPAANTALIGGNISVTGLSTLTGGLSLTGTTSQYVRGDGSLATFGSSAVTSITGTANQVIASGSTGAVTLSLPQSIATTSNVTFANITGAIGKFSGTTGSIGNLSVGTYTDGGVSVYVYNTGTPRIDLDNNVVRWGFYIDPGTNNLNIRNASPLGANPVSITTAGIITTLTRLNVNGAADNANFALNVSGCTYTNSLSPTATQFSTAQTIDANTTYVFTGGAGVTFTMGNPALTNKLFFIKNYSVNTLTIAGYAGGSNIVDTTNTSVASFSLLTGKTAILQQDGGSKTFILLIY